MASITNPLLENSQSQYGTGTDREVARSEETRVPVDFLLNREESDMSLDQKKIASIDLHANEVAHVEPEVLYPVYKVNRTVFGVLLALFIVPGLMYKGMIHLLNWLHPFEKLDRSFTEAKSLHFKVGSSSDPIDHSNGGSLIDYEIRKGSRTTLSGEEGKEYQVLRQAEQKFSSGFQHEQLLGVKGIPMSNDAALSRALVQAEGMTLQVAATSHIFLSGEKKSELLQGDDDLIYTFDSEIEGLFEKHLSNGKDACTEKDYVNAFQLMDETDSSQKDLFEGYVRNLFQQFPDVAEKRHFAILDLLKVEPRKEILAGPHQRAANQRAIEIIAKWAGMPVQQAFGTLDVSNPASVFQVLMIHHIMTPDNKDETKLLGKLFGAGGSFQDVSDKRVVRLMNPERDFSRIQVKWEYELSIGGQTRRYEIREIIGVKAGSKPGRPATVEMHRAGKRIS